MDDNRKNYPRSRSTSPECSDSSEEFPGELTSTEEPHRIRIVLRKRKNEPEEDYKNVRNKQLRTQPMQRSSSSFGHNYTVTKQCSSVDANNSLSLMSTFSCTPSNIMIPSASTASVPSNPEMVQSSSINHCASDGTRSCTNPAATPTSEVITLQNLLSLNYAQQMKAAENTKEKLDGTFSQINEMMKTNKAVSLDWPYFIKSQREGNIEERKKETVEFPKTRLGDMGLSSSKNDGIKKNVHFDDRRNQIKILQDEIDSLKCQLQVSRNEMILAKRKHKEEMESKDKMLSDLQLALDISKHRALRLRQRASKIEAELRAVRRRVERNPTEGNDLAHNNSDVGLEPQPGSTAVILDNDARLISLISLFLHGHPFGANIHYICSYLQEYISSLIEEKDVEVLMRRFPLLFKEKTFGIGANLAKKWFIIGLKTLDRSVV